MAIIEYIKTKVEEFNESIAKKLDEKKINAAGDAKKSLRVSESGGVVKSTGIHYLWYLSEGRRPGKYPPLAPIARWIRIKKIPSTPRVIAELLKQNGSRIYQNRERGLQLRKKADKLSDEINKELPAILSNQIKVEFNKAFKKK